MHEKIKDLYMENEYGIQYLDYYKKADSQLVKYCQDTYNINTKCHGMCVNCQIDHISRYGDTSDWAIKVEKAYVYEQEDLREVVGMLRRFQRVKILKRKGRLVRIQAVINYGVCTRDEEHPRVYRERKSDINQLRCEICESAMSARVHKIEGWVPFVHVTAFSVKCGFVPKSYEDEIPSTVRKTLTKEKLEALLSLIDPVKWARDFLGIELREHQKVDAMCTAKHTVRRWGRRSGKTYSECQKVLRFALTTQISEGHDAKGKEIKRGPVVLVVSPYLAQITLIFDMIRKMVKRNPDIHIQRDIKTPYHYLKFADTEDCEGAVIMGFTAGSSSGAEGGTVRGQGADMMLVDEADDMPEADLLDAVEPIQITTPNVMMMASSTPKGKREWFWKVCTESPHYKETYFPATVLDHWDEVKDEVERKGVTGVHFLQEYMAQFAIQIEGVYQANYVTDAEVDYEYGQSHKILWNQETFGVDAPESGWTYSIGVDWNTNAGVELVIVGLPPNNIEFWVVDAVNIPKHEYQQHIAMEKLIELNRYWNPSFIYVDRGYGGTQLEHLQIFSDRARMREPGSADAKLKDILTAYDFGKKIAYRNPATGLQEETQAKPFLIENSIRQFEQGRIRFSKHDHILHQQLHNYIIAGVSPQGVPRYGMNDKKIGDHRLDALNLALIGYILEMSEWATDVGEVANILHASSFGSQEVRKLVAENERNWIEFVRGVPRGIGLPGHLKVRYDPGYVEMKETQRQTSSEHSRTAEIDNAGRQDTNTLRIGFSSDTEWKYDGTKKPTSRVAHIHSRKPKRRTF